MAPESLLISRKRQTSGINKQSPGRNAGSRGGNKISAGQSPSYFLSSKKNNNRLTGQSPGQGNSVPGITTMLIAGEKQSPSNKVTKANFYNSSKHGNANSVWAQPPSLNARPRESESSIGQPP